MERKKSMQGRLKEKRMRERVIQREERNNTIRGSQRERVEGEERYRLKLVQHVWPCPQPSSCYLTTQPFFLTCALFLYPNRPGYPNSTPDPDLFT